MYKNIGGKIKILAIVVAAIEAILFVILGIYMWWYTEDAFWGLFILIGVVISWVSSFVLYGFGVVVEKLCKIEENTGGYNKSNHAPIDQTKYVPFSEMQEETYVDQKNHTDTYSTQQTYEDGYSCPRCKSVVYVGDNYCKVCGEKLDWN